MVDKSTLTFKSPLYLTPEFEDQGLIDNINDVNWIGKEVKYMTREKQFPIIYLAILNKEDGESRILESGVMLAKNMDEVKLKVSRNLKLDVEEDINNVDILVKPWRD